MPEKFKVVLTLEVECNSEQEAENICEDAVNSYKFYHIDLVDTEVELV